MYSQEQVVVALNTLLIVTLLVVVYIVSIIFMLHTLPNKSESMVSNTHEIHKQRITTLNYKSVDDVPIFTPPEVETEIVMTDELYLLAKIINAEAGNQPYEGMIAVGNVVMNRVESPEFPDTIREVIFQKGQFSPVTNGTINNKPSEKAIQAAKDVMSGDRVVSTTALFFYNPDISTSKWIFTRRTITKIGEHIFAA